MSIATALFSKSQISLLSWLFGQPERSYHLSELRRLTGLGSASLQRELNRLADAGLVVAQRTGNLRLFKANPLSPVFGELVGLVTKSMGAQPLLRETLSRLGPRLHAACIFGSIAKQTDTVQSDIDVLLVGEDLSLAEILELLMPLEARLGRKINPTCYTPAEYQRRRQEADSFVNRVLFQPVLPLIGDILDPAGSR